MKLITFQPLKVKNIINKQGVYYPPDNDLIGKSIFCLKLDKDTMETVYMTAPSMPQIMLTLEVEDSRVTEIDYIQWVNQLNGLKGTKNLSKYKEYCIDYIKSEDIISKQVISKSNNPDIVQTDFMNTHFNELEILSGYEWFRAADEDFADFWGTDKSFELIARIQHCMMPTITPLTEIFVDETRDLLRKIFRIN